MDIYNYLKIDERISTSGQPKAEDFSGIAGQGFQTVINLALPTSDHAIPDEGSIVTRTGMNYVHIPVVWEAPRTEQFRKFADVVRHNENEKIWVHCVANMRVSCFMYLYHRKVKGMPEAEARALMNRIWDPGAFEQWNRFVEDVNPDVPGI
ncbi:MAG: protein tyrosine phosphatase family protein [Gammaproteobacteria bacterium]